MEEDIVPERYQPYELTTQRSRNGNILNVLEELRYACEVIKHAAAFAELKQFAQSSEMGYG
jgi:hypothetical protein